MVLGLLALSLGCKRKLDQNPQAAFEEARAYLHQGLLIKAQEKAKENFALYSDRDPKWAWKFRLLEANVLIMRGLSQDVLSLLQSPIPLDLADRELTSRRLMFQGLAYANLGKFSDAEARLAESRQLCGNQKSGVAPEVITSFGILEVRKGRPEKAEPYFREALNLLRAQDDRFLEAAALLNVGAAAMRQEKFDEAIYWSRAAYDTSRAIGAGLTEEKALGNLGWLFFKMGDFENSALNYEEARQRAHALGAVLDEVEWLKNLGLVNYETNQPETAEALYRQSLSLAESTQNHEQMIDVLTALAFVRMSRGDYDQAEAFSQRAFGLAHGDGRDPDRVAELYPLLVQGQLAMARKDAKRAEQIFTEVARDPKSDVALRWEAQGSLARLRENRNMTEPADQQYREALSTFEAARSTLENEDTRLPFLSYAFRLYDDYIHFLLEHGKTEQALSVADYSRARTLAEGLRTLKTETSFQPSSVAARQLAQRLRSTLLFYWLGENQSYLWTITPASVQLARLPARSQIETAVDSYRKALQGPRDVLDSGNGEGRELYEMLIAPAEKLIPKDSRVFILPDGKLNNLNFETLIVPGPKPHYWIEDVTVASASSLRLLAAAQENKTTKQPKLLLVGDPPPSDPNYPPLANAAAEATNVRKHFPDSRQSIYVRQHATPQAYLQSPLSQFAYIHFVAHGTASRLSPLDSAVVLSRSSAEQDSFKLYARDILRHPLRADLVTISACYTSGSRAYVGEGLVGLSWAFLRAGAHNVIGALWEVSDNSTPQLMDKMYSELAKGRSPASALRAAKLSLLHSDSVFRKPLYWGPFQLYVGS